MRRGGWVDSERVRFLASRTDIPQALWLSLIAWRFEFHPTAEVLYTVCTRGRLENQMRKERKGCGVMSVSKIKNMHQDVLVVGHVFYRHAGGRGHSPIPRGS